MVIKAYRFMGIHIKQDKKTLKLLRDNLYSYALFLVT